MMAIAIVDPTYSYLPHNWTPIAGGLGIFNATVSTSKVMNGAALSGLVVNMLRDATITKEVDPVSRICKRDRSCVSYIIPGGPKTVSPWPYNKTGDESLSAYITSDGPAYQLDFWNAPYGIQWASDSCELYGESGPVGAFQLCASPQGDNVTVAGSHSRSFLRNCG